jgi:hypothetical protein
MNAIARIPEPTYVAGEITASTRALIRAAQSAVGAAGGGREGDSLERRYADAAVPGRIGSATVFETGPFARPVAGAAAPGFAGFLDGVQDSRAAAWLASGVPIVVATIGAVILERTGSSLVKWADGLRVRRMLLVPRDRVDADTWRQLSVAGHVEDTRVDAASHHPDALLLRAVHTVEELRAAQERTLAEAWVATRREPLYVDGGIGSLGAASRASHVVGVVKSHRTIYVDSSRLAALFALGEGERTCVHALAPSSHRPAVWTWYLRLRAPAVADPMHGLARIEIAPRDGAPAEVADEVSRWVLAERTPVSLPDARWDVLAYGVARCEAYLKRGLALQGGEARP